MTTLTQDELKIKIIEQLTLVSLTKSEGSSPSEIALLCGFPRPTNTAKKVNPTLYALQKEGLVIKECGVGNSNPKWKINKNILTEKVLL